MKRGWCGITSRRASQELLYEPKQTRLCKLSWISSPLIAPTPVKDPSSERAGVFGHIQNDLLSSLKV